MKFPIPKRPPAKHAVPAPIRFPATVLAHRATITRYLQTIPQIAHRATQEPSLWTTSARIARRPPTRRSEILHAQPATFPDNIRQQGQCSVQWPSGVRSRIQIGPALKTAQKTLSAREELTFALPAQPTATLTRGASTATAASQGSVTIRAAVLPTNASIAE